mmetsp:Transcript_22783/g.37493  ORF Transcript_22783/g.37493 Transcript_22783/m.37493 type:complete len:226 (+) Transcript_22783:707-1384(+)
MGRVHLHYQHHTNLRPDSHYFWALFQPALCCIYNTLRHGNHSVHANPFHWVPGCPIVGTHGSSWSVWPAPSIPVCGVGPHTTTTRPLPSLLQSRIHCSWYPVCSCCYPWTSDWLYLTLDGTFLQFVGSNLCQGAYSYHCVSVRASAHHVVVLLFRSSSSRIPFPGWPLLLFPQAYRRKHFYHSLWNYKRLLCRCHGPLDACPCTSGMSVVSNSSIRHSQDLYGIH